MVDTAPPVRILSKKGIPSGRLRASTLLELGTPRNLLVFAIPRCRPAVMHLLKSSVLTTNHLGFRNKQVRFGGLSESSAEKQHALDGYLGITVQQYIYIKHGERLSFPELPCIEVYGGNGHIDYYPLELLDCNPY
jgi:hypothetical protein